MFAEEVKTPAREVHWLAIIVLLGMAVLLGRLWHTQVVSRKKYQQSQEIQSIRTVPMMPTRGRIVDVRGRLLAENQPRYDVKLYLEDIRPLFYKHYTNAVRPDYILRNPGQKISRSAQFALQAEARYQVASNLVAQASAAVGTPQILRPDKFGEHYTNKLSLPLTVLLNLQQTQVSAFIEKAAELPGIVLEATPTRVYPHGSLAAHMIGHIGLSEIKGDDEEFHFTYPIQGYAGKTGLERVFDNVLRGTPGVKALLVNNIGYAQRESTQQPPEPGWDVHLTIDLDIQRAADQALAMRGSEGRGAAVVMDVRTGDILAMSSAPTFDLNEFVDGISHAKWGEYNDARTLPLYNRATHGMYPPGSVFKIVTGMAAMEAGLDPKAPYESKGITMLGRRKILDTAGAGIFDFERAFAKSSNPYFIDIGSKIGRERILAMAKQFKLGERTGYLSQIDVPPQERAGYLPNMLTGLKADGLPWQPGDTANLSIGQGEIATTPLQIAVLTAACANRGFILTPRLVAAIRPQTGSEPGVSYDPAPIRGRVHASEESWNMLQKSMLTDVEHPDGTAYKAGRLEGLQICGKTGTAELDSPTPAGDRKITWFASYAPYSNPRYAVVVMQEGGGGGGTTCAPLAREIYKALVKRDAAPPTSAARTLTYSGAR